MSYTPAVLYTGRSIHRQVGHPVYRAIRTHDSSSCVLVVADSFSHDRDCTHVELFSHDVFFVIIFFVINFHVMMTHLRVMVYHARTHVDPLPVLHLLSLQCTLTHFFT